MNISLNTDFIIEEVSTVLLEKICISSSELIGLNFLNCLHNNVPEAYVEKFIQSSKLGIDGNYIFQLHINNQDFWFLTIVNVIQNTAKDRFFKLGFFVLDGLSLKNAKAVYEIEKFNKLIAEALV